MPSSPQRASKEGIGFLKPGQREDRSLPEATHSCRHNQVDIGRDLLVPSHSCYGLLGVHLLTLCFTINSLNAFLLNCLYKPVIDPLGYSKARETFCRVEPGPAGVGVGMGSEKKCNLAEADYRMCIHLLGLPEQSAINQTQPGIDNGRNCLSQAW